MGWRIRLRYNRDMKNMSLFLLFVSLVPSVFGYSAEELLEAVPAECSDEAYLRFNETGNRTEWGKPYGQRTTVIEQLIDAEEKEGKGRFLPKLAEFLEALLAMRTWTLNAHDGALKSFNNEQPIVELGSARLGLSVARAVTLFGGKLPADLVRRARAELERRIFEPYLKTAAEAKADPKRTKFSISEHWWFRTCNNWNAVCHSLVVRSATRVLSGRNVGTCDDRRIRRGRLDDEMRGPHLYVFKKLGIFKNTLSREEGKVKEWPMSDKVKAEIEARMKAVGLLD